jgi:glycerophosphoryl diester phosphodiesterase
MRILKKISLFLLVVIIIMAGLFIAPYPKYSKDNLFLDKDVLVIAHGGGRGVFPGNTFSAFEYSYNLGVDVLELDVHLTIDNILVTRHGENETGNIKAMSNCDTVIWNETYEYLYDNCNFGFNFEDETGEYPYRDLTHEEWVLQGVYMTKLEELFEAFGDSILYTIEIKADADAPRNESADELYRLIDKYDLFDVVLAATAFEDISEYITSTYPKMAISTSHAEAQKFIIGAYSFTSIFYKPNGYAALQIPTEFNLPVIGDLNLSTKLLINAAHKHNMAVHYWTINDPDEMRRLIELGCDGIITDYPEVLMDILEEYN